MKITRREFIKRSATSAMAVGLLPYLPASARPSSELSSLAAVALDKARSLGAGYADIRINRVYTQAVTTREMRVLNVVNNENYGFGVRVLVDGAWGFAACPRVEKDEIARIASQAVEIARANKVLLDKPIILAPEPAHVDVWQTPITKDPFKISIQSKIDLLLEANRRAIAAQKEPYRLFCTSGMNFVKEEKFFASTDGSLIEQTIVRSWPSLSVTAVDKTTGKFQSCTAFTQPMGMG